MSFIVEGLGQACNHIITNMDRGRLRMYMNSNLFLIVTIENVALSTLVGVAVFFATGGNAPAAFAATAGVSLLVLGINCYLIGRFEGVGKLYNDIAEWPGNMVVKLLDL